MSSSYRDENIKIVNEFLKILHNDLSFNKYTDLSLHINDYIIKNNIYFCPLIYQLVSTFDGLLMDKKYINYYDKKYIDTIICLFNDNIKIKNVLLITNEKSLLNDCEICINIDPENYNSLCIKKTLKYQCTII